GCAAESGRKIDAMSDETAEPSELGGPDCGETPPGCQGGKDLGVGIHQRVVADLDCALTGLHDLIESALELADAAGRITPQPHTERAGRGLHRLTLGLDRRAVWIDQDSDLHQTGYCLFQKLDPLRPQLRIEEALPGDVAIRPGNIRHDTGGNGIADHG